MPAGLGGVCRQWQRNARASAWQLGTRAARSATHRTNTAAARAPAEHMSSQKPRVVGLTGSIGMGKSTVSAMFAARGVPVCDADAIVHELYASGGEAVPKVQALFPPGTDLLDADGGIDRRKLSPLVVGDGAKATLKQLEDIVHPLVTDRRKRFVDDNLRTSPFVIVDVPLLYETGGEKDCDAVVVVSTADAQVQRERVLARPNMTAEKLDAILKKQVPDEQKRSRADFVINTATSLADTEAQVDELVRRFTEAER
ncbi:dephospho-CoA kinase [Pseudoscourfieldia marina]